MHPIVLLISIYGVGTFFIHHSIVPGVRYSSVSLFFKGNKMFSVTPSQLCHFRHRAMVVVNTPFGMGAALDFAKKEFHQHSNLI